MSKTSKRAILTIIVIATLLTVMIPIVPVIAQPDYYTPQEDDKGLVTWSDVNPKSGSHSMKLELPAPVEYNEVNKDEARVKFDYYNTLNSLSTISFSGILEESILRDFGGNEQVDPGFLSPYVTFSMDRDGIEGADAWVVVFTPENHYPNLDTWYGVTVDDNSIVSVAKDPIGDDWHIDLQSPISLGVLKTTESSTGGITWGEGKVLEVKVGLGNWDAEKFLDFGQINADQMGKSIIAYVDDVTINGDIYSFDLPGEGFSIDYVTPGDVDYGDVLTVIGSGVTAGSEIIAYWDYATGTGIHPLNNTEGNPDGSFDIEVKVPSDVVGNHYLWVKDVATAATVRHGPITMVPKITLSPSSGLENDDITIKGYGFADDSEITFIYELKDERLSDDTGTDETDDLGYFEYTFEVDTDLDEEYLVTAEDEKGNDAEATFKLGAAITIDPVEGPTGIKVKVEGRGWANGDIMTFRDKANHDTEIEVVDAKEIKVGSSGTFNAELVIPKLGNEGDYDIEAYGNISKATSSDAFELLGLPEIVVTPTYGTPGSTITVKGYNFTQIAGTEVEILLLTPGTENLVIAETDSNGNFEDTFISPAVTFTTYDVEATDDYGLFATDPFKVGLIALIINPVYGQAGTKLSITGIGFAPGDYNVTFGTILYEEYGDVSGGDAISDTFYVPNVLTGIYDITISDTDENEMTVEFRVTAVTEVTLDPAMAPNDYNVTIEGINFADKDLEDVDFVLYNATDEWDMDVWQDTDGTDRVETCADGNFTAWWEVLDEDTLSLGDYTINVTSYDDFIVQIPFSVVEAQVSVAPRKALFDRGDTIQFNVKNDFDFPESYMKIWDPDDNLYWETVEFLDWVKSGDLYTVPYYLQTSGGNPMELSQDAPLGPWFWVFYEKGTTQLTNGTFEVGPSAESLIAAKIELLSDELGIDIDTLRTVIDDLGIDMDDAVSSMAEDIAAAVSSMGADIAGLSDDLDDAVSGMQDDLDDMGDQMTGLDSMINNLADSTTNAQEAANDAKISADQATEAAESNQQATSGLTGLVYGAIGASLIAALAAIVSLMQISKRIAG